MDNSYATAGNSGPKVRSDCEVNLEITSDGGIVTDIRSKVKIMYGESIRQQVVEVLDFFGISNALVRIDDSGALPFVISARLEAAVRKLMTTELEYLPETDAENNLPTTRDRFRFARLYIPGNTPSMMINAGLHDADGIILDLEDSVAPDRKDEARILVRNALRQLDFKGSERMVRINQGERGLRDLDFIVPHKVNLVLIPKCCDVQTIREIENRISLLQRKSGLSDPVFLMPIIENALGVEMAFDIARCSSHIVAMAVGLEDLTADMGVIRTKEGNETLYARTRVINAAKAAGIQPIDSVFSDVSDMESLAANVATSKALGFEGMGCIHPRQIHVIKQGFYPGPEELDKAKKVVFAFEEAGRNGLGVVALGSKMIDAPVVARARKTIELAIRLNLLSPGWMDETAQEKEQI